MIKRFAVILFLLPLIALAQEAKKETSITFYGFVRNDFYLDTYKGINAFQDVFYVYPSYIGVDANGKDINKQASANMVSVVTRGGINITGPVIFGAKTIGCIEADFAGKPEIFLLRLRKAYTQFLWEKTKLLVGQTWHPFFGNDAFPRIGGLNTGAPFQSFNRSPQVRLDYSMKSLTLSLTGLYQQQYVSVGPIGSSNMYKRDAVVPETVLSLEYIHKGLTLGAGVDFDKIKPRVSTTGTDKKTYISDNCLNSTSWMAYGKYVSGKLMMLLKGYYGQDMAHLTMIGGLGVSNYNPVTGNEKYTNFNTYSTLFNITYGTKWRPGLLLGYSENLGTESSLDPNAVDSTGKPLIWGLGINIMDMYRFCPSLSYSLPKFLLQAEYEMTKADYGVGQFNYDNGLYAGKHAAVNNGVRVVMTYYF